jgi:formyl-CoA transferase
MLRISGYGQTGPYRDKPGFGVVAEAMGGLRHLSGEPGRTPVRVGVSIGDTLAALHGVIGVLMALHARQHQCQRPRPGHRRGAVRSRLQLHGKPAARVQRLRRGARAGRQRPARHRAQQRLPLRDGQVLVAGNGDSIFKRLMAWPSAATTWPDPGLAHNPAAWPGWTRSTPPSAPGRRADRGRRAGRAGRRQRAGRPHLHRGRHRADPHFQARGMLRPTAVRSPCRAWCRGFRARPAASTAWRPTWGRTRPRCGPP